MLERGELGADHAEVGQWLTTNWNLPVPLCVSIAHSHGSPLPDGTATDIAKLARVVAVSGLLADIWVREDAQEATITAREAARVLLGMNPPQLDPVLNSIAGSMAEVSSLFEIDLGTADEINSVLDEAQETLMMVTLGNSRQAASAQQALQHDGGARRLARHRGGVAARSAEAELANNRARLDSFIAAEVQTAARTGKPLSLIIADVDHFKKVNDTYGHPAGDKVLTGVANCLKTKLRPRDLVARYGGEEFVLVLPETDAEGAMVVAERVRRAIEAAVHPIGNGQTLRVTMISLGCATLGGKSAFILPDDLLASADKALYAAKRGGRNQAIAFESMQPTAGSAAG